MQQIFKKKDYGSKLFNNISSKWFEVSDVTKLYNASKVKYALYSLTRTLKNYVSKLSCPC